MKGSTLHRSGLTREKMGVLATFSQNTKKQNTRSQLNQYYKATKAQELDLLWDGVQKGIQKVHSATKNVHHKSPVVYLGIGFVAGVIFMSCVTLIISISAMAPKAIEQTNAQVEKNDASIAVIGEDTSTVATSEPTVTEEKYIIKKGDTIGAIAYRFYGKYSDAKIEEILRVNNIKNPAGLKIGQELIIPVER